MRLNIFMLERGFFYFFSQGRHKNSQAGDVVGVAAPDLVQDVVVGQHLPDIFGQQT
ncbi:hypothetical protein D1872_342750 [compost metagenome]